MVVLLIAACGKGEGSSKDGPGPDGDPTDGPSDTDPTVPDPTGDALTTWDDVAPIVEARCTGCHQDGGTAPMALTSAADAAPWAQVMVEATATRAMPPWLVTSDGSCGTFRDAEWLSDDELATIAAWAEDGAPAGERVEPLVPQPPPTLGDRRDLALVTPEIVPESENDVFAPNDEYRCVKFENTTGADYFLTGYEVAPGNPALVHHVLAMVVDPAARGWGLQTNGEAIADMEDDDPRPGWDCLGTVGGTAREKAIPGTWAPGQGAVEFPDGLGVRVRAGDWVVVQIHYNLVDPAVIGQSDSTTIYLRTETEVAHEAYVALPDPFIESLFGFRPDEIPPGESAAEYTWEMSGTDLLYRAYVDDPGAVESFRLWSVMPHMHQRGRKQSLTIRRADGTPECAMDVPAWDFEWQRIYFYETPVALAPDDAFEVTCTYDTTDTTEPVTPGWGTQNEMCLVVMMVTLD